MTKRLISYINYLFFLGGGIFLIYWQLSGMGEKEKADFLDAIRRTNYWYVIPIATMSICSHLSRSMRWKIMMEPLGYQPTLSNTFGSTMIGYMANAAVPRLGEIIKCSLLSKYEKLRIDQLIGTIIIERGFDLICYAFFICLTVIIQINTIGKVFKEKFSDAFQNGNVVLIKISLMAVICFSIYWLIRRLFKKFPSNSIFQKIGAFFKGVAEGLKTIKKLKNKKQFIYHTLFIWAMYLGQIYLGFKGMTETSGLSIQAACSVLTLASLSMILTPGGIGSFPIFVSQTLLIYGISASSGLAFGWVMWGVSTGITLLIGCIFLIILPVINKRV